jgi:3-dehydroquinate synthase II
VERERVAIAPIAADVGEFDAIVERARRRGFRRFVLTADRPFVSQPNEEIARRRVDTLELEGRPAVPVVSVADPDGLDRALARVAEGGAVAIEWTDDRMIPLENAIAARVGRREIWTYARSASEIPGVLGALEHGADRVIIEAHAPADIDRIESVLEGLGPDRLEWTAVPVLSVEPAGLGDRVLVDTTSLLRPSEGLLVGSAAAFLFHVASEAVGSRFSRPRPFRVNAGAAHSYVLMSDGSTRYLAELAPGDSVLATDPQGPRRAVRVGRVKLERRPMVLIVGDDRGTRRTVFLQEAETVRLSAAPARIPTTELVPGTSVSGVRLPPARHLGRAIDESIEER